MYNTLHFIPPTNFSLFECFSTASRELSRARRVSRWRLEQTAVWSEPALRFRAARLYQIA